MSVNIRVKVFYVCVMWSGDDLRSVELAVWWNGAWCCPDGLLSSTAAILTKLGWICRGLCSPKTTAVAALDGRRHTDGLRREGSHLLMAVVGPSRHSRVSMPPMPVSMMQGGGGSLSSVQQFYHPSNHPNNHPSSHPTSHQNSQPTHDFLPDRPIGYGAFGIVWWVHSKFVLPYLATGYG